jgi:D-proline reductase (dithiol) PrdB
MAPHELPLRYRALLAAYRWRRPHPPAAAATLRVPLAEARVALVSSAGLVAPGDVPFDLAERGGDSSLRVLPHDVAVATLEAHHRSDAFDRGPLTADRNVAFPLDRLRELVAEGVVGAAAPRHLSFMGSITAPGRLVRETAPAAARLLLEDGVDVALLVPV